MQTQQEIDAMAEALRAHGLTWRQTNFAVSLVRNAVAAERELCASISAPEIERLRGMLAEAYRWIPGTPGTIGDIAANGLRGRIDALLRPKRQM